MKYLIYILVAAAVLVGGFFALNTYIYKEKQGPTDYKNATYVVEGEPVTLSNGVSADGSTRYFGNEVTGDLNADGRPDRAFLLTSDGGGSGIFYYLVGALQTEAGTYNGTRAVFVGDRIAPQTTEFQNGIVVVNYADRAPGEPMTAQPSVGKTLRLKYDPVGEDFGIVANNFEGEADPSRMTLSMQTWVWDSALYNDGREITPKKTGAFTLTFKTDGTFTATTDCNQMGGSYTTAANNQITFGDIYMTKMFCEGSQEIEFSQMLSNTSGYHFTSRGQLILDLKFDSGSVVFH